MSLYYESGDSKKINSAYSENKKVWLVYKGSELVWSFKENYASMKLSDSTYKTWYFTNGHSIRFYDMRNLGLTSDIKAYKDVTNHKKHCRNVYANTYNLLEDGSYKETGIYSCTGNFTFDYEDDINLYPACGVLPFGPTLNIDTNSIPYTYYVKNSESPGSVDRIDTIRDYSFFNGLFRNCKNMHSSFSEQSRLNGKAVCGIITKDFSECFNGCSNISEAVCGPVVENMVRSYKNCANLQGNAACGPFVTNMQYAYSRCDNIQQAVCGDSVVDMGYAYEYCSNLNGYAACGSSVINMHGTYYRCNNLQYGVCGDNVEDFSDSYRLCTNLIECYVGNNVTNMYRSFINCFNLKTAGCGESVENMRLCFTRCYNLQSFYISNNAVDIDYCYQDCRNMYGDVYIPSNVTSCVESFASCYKITSATVKSSYINNFYQTFRQCNNLSSITFDCDTDNIINIEGSFRNCRNLKTFYFKSGNFENVTKMKYCFSDCVNLSMHAIIPPIIEDLGDAYSNCQNVYGSITLPNTIKGIYHAFSNSGITSITFPNIDEMSWSYAYHFIDRSKDIINKYGTVTIYCPENAGILNTIKGAYNFYKTENNITTYTGHNDAYDIDLVLI